jgi:hypothetical protein
MCLCEMAQIRPCAEVPHRHVVWEVIVGLGLVHEEQGDLPVACMGRDSSPLEHYRWGWRKRNW